MSEPMDDVLIYLEALGDEGRSALRIAGRAWEESWRRADERARLAESQLRYLRRWAREQYAEGAARRERQRWDYREAYRGEPARPWHERRIEERRQKLQALHMRLEEAIEANYRTARIADRDRLRAETAERECDELMAEIGRLRTLANF
jgi:hypothetical protein